MAKKIEKYLPVDYSDSFSIEVTENRLSPKDIILKVFAHNPAWLRMLYAIRACLVKPFGIETKAIESEELIIEEDKQEAIMRKDDKHLLFYVDIFITPLETGKQMIEVTTLVKYHNWVGKAYFFCVKPFHRIIVPLVLKKSAMLNKHSRGCNYITNMKNEICNIEVHDFRKLMHEE